MWEGRTQGSARQQMGLHQADGGGSGAAVFGIPGWSWLFRRKMIRGWGLAGGQGALLTGPGNSIPPHPLALLGISALRHQASPPSWPGCRPHQLLRTSRLGDTQRQASGPSRPGWKSPLRSFGGGVLTHAHYVTGTSSTYDPVLPLT